MSCSQSKSLFCEDFERGSLDMSAWTVDTSSGSTITVDAMKAAPGGRFALHAHPNNVPPSMTARSWATVTTTKSFPLASNDLFVRVYVYLEDRLAIPERHFMVMSAWGVDPLPNNEGLPYLGVDLVPVAVASPGFMYLWYHGGNEADTKSNRSNDRPRAGGWSCWEWQIRGAKELNFSLDDKDLSRFVVTAADGWQGPAGVRLQLGMYLFHNDGTHPGGFNLWIDQIAVNDRRMGCSF